MTNTKAWIVLAVAAVMLLVAGFVAGKSQVAKSFGAVGSQLIEQYNPYVLYNGGINSALPITTTGNITAGGTLSVPTTNTATSTVSSGCFQENATSTASVGHFVVGQSYIATSTFEGTVTRAYPVFWVAGGCPNL